MADQGSQGTQGVEQDPTTHPKPPPPLPPSLLPTILQPNSPVSNPDTGDEEFRAQQAQAQEREVPGTPPSRGEEQGEPTTESDRGTSAEYVRVSEPGTTDTFGTPAPNVQSTSPSQFGSVPHSASRL